VDTGSIRRLAPATRGDPDRIAAGFTTCPPITAVRDDPGSDDYRWLVVVAGSGSAEDERGRRHVLTPGRGFVRAPHTPHRIRRDQDGRWLEFFIRLTEACHAGLVAVGAIDPALRHFDLGPPARWLPLARSVYERVAAPPAEALAATCELLALLHHPADRRHPLERARRRLERDLAAPLVLAAVAEAAGYGRDGFRLAFRRRFGTTPKAWRIRARVRAGRALLMAGASVGEAAERLGYPDAFTFSKQVKRVTGRSPSHFRP